MVLEICKNASSSVGWICKRMRLNTSFGRSERTAMAMLWRWFVLCDVRVFHHKEIEKVVRFII